MSSAEIRSLIKLAMENKDYKKVYELLETYPYDDGEDLVSLWDKAHYLEKFNRDHKPLTPLIKFRIRQRFPPPRSILPTEQRQVKTLPNYARQILECWYAEHQRYPYPALEKAELSRRTG
ncbi:homeobox protein SIX2-like [Ptychodera flava]|uniref:homeobox protein SIX2-like n=1 Tax=Ptychodera flava TaxID=63121 RepID=UPI00396A450A